jgi:hypothetical protein
MCEEFTKKCGCSYSLKSSARVHVLLVRLRLPAQQRFDLFIRQAAGARRFFMQIEGEYRPTHSFYATADAAHTCNHQRSGRQKS